MAGVYTNGLPSPAPGTQLDSLSGLELLPADTQLPAGENPGSVGATSFQIAALAAGLIGNVGTVATGTVTLNVASGLVNTGSLTTAAGSTASFTIVDSLAVLGAPVQIGVSNGTNVTGAPVLTSATIANAGTIAVSIKNAGTAAFAGSLLVPFQVGSGGV
jgi:hypothetical protein